mgnify:CR=1 FL=1
MFMKSAAPKSYVRDKRRFLINLLAATALAGSAGFASAQTVIDTPVVATVFVPADGGTVTVTDTGSITVIPGTVAIDAATFSSTITLFGPVSASTVGSGLTTINSILQNGGTNSLIVHQGGNISASAGASNATLGSAVFQETSAGTNSVTLANATISASSLNDEISGIIQDNETGDNLVQFGSTGRINVNSASDGYGVNQSQIAAATGNNSLTLGANYALNISTVGDGGGVRQFARDGNNAIELGKNGSLTIDAGGAGDGLAQATTSGDNLIEIGADGTLTIDAVLRTNGTTQRNRFGDNSTLVGENWTLAVTSGEDAAGIDQTNDNGDNTSEVGANGTLSVTTVGLATGIRQTNSDGENSLLIRANNTMTATAELDATGIEQLNGTGDNTLQIEANGDLTVTAAEDAIGINQDSNTGASAIQLGRNGSLNVSGTIFVTGIRQFTLGSGSRTLTIGQGARINVSSLLGEITGISQTSSNGTASATVGSDSIINIFGGSTARGIFQSSAQNEFTLGENSLVKVVSDTGLGVGLQQFTSTGSNTATVGANSRIDVVAGANAFGISSSALSGVPSFLTLARGVEVNASGDRAFGVNIAAQNFTLQNRGRIIATSTNATQESFGVRMFGDDNTFVNHGTVFADLAAASHAILMDGNNNMLSLLTYPVIQGQITFGDGGGTFGTGNTLTVGNGFDAVYTVGADPAGLTVVGQGQPLFVNQIGPNLLQVVSLGTNGTLQTSRTSSIRMSDDLVRFLQQHINTRSIQNRQFLYQDTGLLQDFWFDASGFGQHSTSGRNYSHALGAFTIGYDRALEANALGGVYGGYSIGSVTTGGRTYDNQLQTAYAGAYYDRSFDRIVTGFNLLGGISWDDTKRSYLDNTVPGGIASASNNGNGFLISPEITAGYEVPYRSILVIPTISGRYTFFHQDGYTESTANGFTLSDLNRQQINIRLELTGVGFGTLNPDGSGWNTILRGGMDVYTNWGDDIDASFAGTTIRYGLLGNDTGVRPFVGADVEYRLNERAKLDFGAEGAYDTVRAVFGSINAGFSVLF